MTTTNTVPELVLDWTKDLVVILQGDYDRQYSSVPTQLQELRDKNLGARRYEFKIETGRKYHKIVATGQGVHAFIDKKTGQVYKPASYKAPAKHVRYDLRVIEDRARCYQNADWAGGYLYLRG